MKFNDQVLLFNWGAIPMVGNFTNRSVAGLTAAGNELCHQSAQGAIDRAAAYDADEQLMIFLEGAGFFEESEAGGLRSAYLHVTQRYNLKCRCRWNGISVSYVASA